MHRRTAGIVLLCISAFLYGIKYLSAAIFGSGVLSWNKELFNAMLSYVGEGPIVLSRLALIGGVCYLIIAEFEPQVKKVLKGLKSIFEIPGEHRIKSERNDKGITDKDNIESKSEDGHNSI